jgi:hypothetical protein
MANKIITKFLLDKNGKVKLGVALALLFLLILIPLVVSVLNVKESYLLGEDLRIDLRGKGNYTAKLITPSKTLLKEGSEDLFLYSLNELGNYELKFKFDEKSESYSFTVVNEIIEEKKIIEENIFEEEKLEDEIIEGIEIEENKELSNIGEIKVGETVKWKRKINNYNGSEIKINVPVDATNLSVFENGFKKEFSSEKKNSALGVMNVFSSLSLEKEIILENVSGELEVFYETPAPEKEERQISQFKKEVVISAPDYLGYENVFASTKINEFAKTKEELKIFWREENKSLDFVANDTDGNGFIDEVSWIVPHLSTQTFEIIYITRAEHLDVNREFIEEVYDEVKEIDSERVFVSEGEYLRVTFEKGLDSSKDITIYAESNDSALVEVYEKDSNELLTTFDLINNYSEYKIFLINLIGVQDTFDLNVVSGNVYFDYVVDPTTILRPNGDVSTNWDAGCSGDYTCVDEVVTQPSAGDGNARRADANDDGLVESYQMETAMVGTVTDITVWMYSYTEATTRQPDVNLNLGGLLTPQTAAWGISYGWTSLTWTGLSGTQADLDDLQVIFTANAVLNSNREHFLDTVYVEVTYDSGFGNNPPTDPVPSLNTTDGQNDADSDLNCFDTLVDLDADAMNVSVLWYKNDTIAYQQDYNNSYASGSFFNAILNQGNMSLGDIWLCSMRLNDGENASAWVNSSAIMLLPYVGQPAISLDVLWPTSSDVYVEKGEFFNVTLNLTCTSGNCGTIDVTLDPIIQTYNDFETGTEGFEHFALNEKNDQWHISTESTNNGTYSWKVGDTGAGSYLTYSDSVLVSPIYDLEDNHTFDFYHYMYVENSGYDGGLLEYRIDESGPWLKFDNFISGGYNANYNEYNGGPNLIDGEAIWGDGYVGSSGAFSHVVANISNFTGDNVTFRFHFFADDSVVREGWYIDSVNFTTEVPGMEKGIIPLNSGSPFYTNASANPLTSSFLSFGQSEIMTFFVNATGFLDSKYIFFAYANSTSNSSVRDITDMWNVTIAIAQELPNITILYPTSGNINDATPVLNINLTNAGKSLWYNINGGANQTLCNNCDGSNEEILYLRESDYLVNVYVKNSMGQENHESVSFTVDMNNNYYDSFEDSSPVYSKDGINSNYGNITLELINETVVDESFTYSGDWSLIGGQWQTASGELIQRQNADDSIAYYDLFVMDNDTDYNLTYELYSTDNDYSGFVFGYENSSNYYRCQVRQQAPIDAEIVQVSTGIETIISTYSDGTSYPLNSWSNMLLEIKNHTVSCYVDGVLAAQAIDIYYPEGKLGIYNDLNLNARHDNFIATITGGQKKGSFTSYSIDLIDTITKFTNITWNEASDRLNNIMSIEVSADEGANWYEAINNQGLSSISTGDNFIYRVFFEIEDLSYLSLLDLNISWSNTIEPPPEIYIQGIDSVQQDFTPILNVTLSSSAAALLMSSNGGANQTICTNCEGSKIFPIVLEEGNFQKITFYANNSVGTYSSNNTSFTVYFNKYYYDDFLDNSSIMETEGVLWNEGNMTFSASTSQSSSVYSWDANDQTGDTSWANSGRIVYSYRNILEAGSINTSGDFVRVNFVSGTDGSLGINNPTICERSGTTSDCVDGTWTGLKFEGANNYVIPSTSSMYTDWLEYDIDETKDYLITFYVDGTNTAVSYLSPASVMVYSVSGIDYSNIEDWSSLSPTVENLMYGVDGMDVKSTIVGGVGNFTSHVMNTSQEVNRISYIGWTETGVTANNNISVEVTVDNGLNWNLISNGGSLSGFTPGSNLAYRALYSANSIVNISMNDMNITWESPPTISILYPQTYVYNTPVTQMNYSIDYASGVTLDTCWYSLNLGGTNTTINCNQNITGITSVDGENIWFIYANDSSGSLGFKSVTFSVDTSAPIITFINQTDNEGNIVDGNNPLYEGDSLILNVNVSDTSTDSVWVIIWENVIGGVQKAVIFLSNLFGDTWTGEIDTNESFGEDYNYTIYANDTTGLFDSYNGSFNILKLVLNLNLNPLISIGNENIFMTGYLNLSNGTTVSNNAINFWIDNILIPFENLTNQGISANVLNFTEDEIKIVSSYDNVTYSSGEFTLDGTNTSGSITGILDAGARVDWDKVIWSSVANPCSGSVDFQEGNSNSYSGTEDSYVTNLNQNTNYGDSLFLTVDSSPDIERSLVKFNDIIGFGANKIPYGSTISSATFRLTVYDTGDNPNFYEFLESWNEDEATYLYRTDSDLWSSVGFATSPSINPTSIGYMGTSTAGTKALDVTTTLQRWVDRDIENNGFAIQPIGSGNVLFRSKEYTTQSERPRLSATFSSSDCTGVLVYVRTSNDKINWSGWIEIFNGGNITDSFGLSRYLEYKVEMGSYNSSYNPQLQELTFNYTGAFTDSNGFFNYSFISSDVFGSYDINVTSGYKSANANVQSALSVQSGIPPEINLVRPTNATWINSSSWNLTYNATDLNGDFSLALLILDGVSNVTNSSIINSGENYFIVSGLNGGIHNWSVNLSDVASTDSSEVWEFYVDLINPEIELISPSNNSDYSVGILNLSFKPTDNLDNILSCDVILDSSTIHARVSVSNNTEINVSSGAIGGGAHYWNVTCYDESLRNVVSDTWRFTVTDTPPTVSLVSPIDNYVDSDGNLDFVYLPNDGSGMDHCDLLINGQVNETNNSINLGVNNFFNVSGFSEGFYNWSVACYDLSLTSDIAANRTIGVDLNGPSIVLVNPDNESLSSSGIVNFEINVTDFIDNSLNCSIYVDGSENSNFIATSGVIINRDSSSLNDSQRYWYVNCIDDSNHSGVSEIRMVDIQESPTVFLNNINESFQQGNSFIIQFTPYDNTDIDFCTAYLNGASNETMSSGISLDSINNLEIEGLFDGKYNYYVNCSDGLGLSGVTEENVMFIDNVAPEIIIYFPNGEDLYSSNITFEFEVIDFLSENMTCNLSVDSVVVDQDFSMVNATNDSRIISGILDGYREWSVTCWDNATNTNTTEVFNFTKYTAPGIYLISPEDESWMNLNNFNFTYLPQDDEGFLKTQFIINDAVYMENQSVIVSGVNNYFEVNLVDGIYNWSVNVTDITSMVGESETWRVYVDTSAPQVDFVYPLESEVVDDNNVSFTFNITENLDSFISCNLSIDGDVEFIGELVNGTNIVYVPLTDGGHNWNTDCIDEAGNLNSSGVVNFTVFAPPKINLESPANNFMTTNETITFSYTPIDALGLNNCSIYIDNILEDTDGGVIKNVVNNFTLGSIIEGKHNWFVECTDTDLNINQSASRNFTRDLTSPTIILDIPANDSGIDFNLGSVTFRWKAIDYLDRFPRCDLIVDGVVEANDKLVTNDSFTTEIVNGLGIGGHYWNVSCWDSVNNTNYSENRFFNISYPDFFINSSNIVLNDSDIQEGDAVLINVSVENIGYASASNILVQFYQGNPLEGGIQIGNNQTVNINNSGSIFASEVYSPDVGINEIYILIDQYDDFVELDENNNLGSKNISVGAWQFFYGDMNSESDFALAGDSDIITWNITSFEEGSIFVADVESSIYWIDLIALGKNLVDVDTANDFADVDNLLSMEGFVDSVSNLYLGDEDVFSVFGKFVDEVPVTNSTNNTNFVTGILWDGHDDTGDGEFDIGDSEDLVFVTKLNEDSQGAYGIYDYEMRVPANLRTYSGTGSEVVFYVEVY